MRFTEVTSQWHALEKGIMAGCTIHVTFFVTAMNIIFRRGYERV